MTENTDLNQIISKFLIVKRKSRLKNKPDQSVKHLHNSLITPTSTPLKKIFIPQSDYISLNMTSQNISKLYSNKLIPPHNFSTSSKLIQKLTKNVYFPTKSQVNNLSSTNSTHELKLKKRKHLNLSKKNKSLDILEKSCDQLIRENKTNLKYFVKKNKLVKKDLANTQLYLEQLISHEKSGSKYFTEKLKEGREFLVNLYRIKSSSVGL